MTGLLLGGAFSDFGVIMAHIGMYGNRVPHLTLFWISQTIAMLCHIGFTSAMTALYQQLLMEPKRVGREYWDKANPTSISTFEMQNGCNGFDECADGYIALLEESFVASMALGWAQAAIMLLIGPFLWYVVQNLKRASDQAMHDEEIAARWEARRKAEGLS